MKIYFSGSITGGREHQEYYEIIISKLKQYGEVLSEFVGDKSLTSYGTKDMSFADIYKRDIGMIEDCDILVADITTPSTGVGYEIAYAEKLNKKILALYKEQEGKRVSAMITGNSYCKVCVYETKEDIQVSIEKFFVNL